MATRFYFSATQVPTQTPGFAAWTRTTEGIRRNMAPTKDGTTLTSVTAWANTSPAANASALFVQFISPPMQAGVGFVTTDTIKCVFRVSESATNDNINRQPICLKVYSSGGVLQATLKALGHIGPATTEWPTSLTNRRAADGDVLDANYTTSAGDYLVLEIGGQVDATGGTTVTGTISIGSSAASDLLEDETSTTANNPWFESSRNIAFQYSFSFSDNLGVNTAASRISPALRNPSDNIGQSDSTARTSAALRAINENLALSDLVLRSSAAKRSLSENLALSDLALRSSAAFRPVSDNLGLSDLSLRSSAALRSISDNLGLHDAAYRTSAALRLVSNLLGIHDAVSIAGPVGGFAGGPAGFNKRKRVKYSTTIPGSDLTDYPVLLRIVADNDIGAELTTRKFAFTAADGTTVIYYGHYNDFSTGATYRRDNCTRANSTSGAGIPSDAGSAWSDVGSPTLGIASNLLYAPSGTGQAVLETSQTEGNLYVTFPVAPSGGDSYILFRYVDASNFWMVILKGDGSGLRLYKQVAGVNSLGGTYATSIANGDTVRVSVFSNTFNVYVNSTIVITGGDADNAAGTKVGLILGDSSVRVSAVSFGIGTTATVRFKNSLSGSAVTGDGMAYLYYSNTGTDQTNRAGSLPSGRVLFMPMEEDPSGSAPQMLDWSGNHHGTSHGSMVSGDLVSGQVASGLNFDGAKYVSIDDAAELRLASTEFTISLWAKANNSTDSPWAITKKTTTYQQVDGWEAYAMTNSAPGGQLLFDAIGDWGDDPGVNFARCTPTRDTSFHRYDVWFNGLATMLLFVDSVSQSQSHVYGASVAIQSGTDPIYIAIRDAAANAGAYQTNSVIDEVTIDTVARSQEWLTYAYQNESNNPATVTLGVEEVASSGGTTISVTDAIGFVTSVSRLVSSFRAFSDNLGESDTVARQSPAARLISDLLGVSDSTARRSAAARLLSDSLGLSDSVLRSSAGSRLVSDLLAFVDSGSGGGGGSDSPLAIQAANVVASWNFDSSLTADQTDSQTLTNNNTVTSAAGKFGNAANFAATSLQYLSAASSATVQAGDINFMLRVWVKPTSASVGFGRTTSTIIIGKDADSPANSRDYTLDIDDAPPYGARFYFNGGTVLNQNLVRWGAALTADVWSLIHAWHDATNNIIGISVNAGIAVTADTTGEVPQTSNAEFRIGARAYSGFEGYFDGLIDDALLMKNSFLNTPERAADYNSGTGVAFANWPSSGSLAAQAAYVTASWNFDSSLTADQTDSQTLTNSNTVTSVAGKFGNAANFVAASSQSLYANSAAALQFGNINCMIRMWVQLASKSDSVVACAKENNDAASDEYRVYYDSGSDRWVFAAGSNGDYGTFIGVAANNFGSPSVGVPYLLHCWFDAANQQIGISVNAGTADTASLPGGIYVGTAEFLLGGRHDHVDLRAPFDGIIDDVVLMKNSFLSAMGRTADYNSGTGVAFADWPSISGSGGGGGVSRLVHSFRALADNLGVSDSVLRSSAAFRSILDLLATTDTVSRQSAAVRRLIDQLGLTDAAVVISILTFMTSDSLGLHDSTTRSSAAFRALADNLGLSDVASRSSAALRALADNLGLVDTPTRSSAAFRTVSDLLAISDSVSRSSAAFRTTTDSLGVSDAASRSSVALRLVSDSIGFSDAASRASAAFRSIADNLAISDATSRTSAAFRAVSDLLAISDSVSRSSAARRTLADSLGLTDAANRSSAAFRALADNLGLSDAANRSSAARRALADNLGLSDLASRSSADFRQVSDNLGESDSVARTSAAVRSISDLLGEADALTRTSAASRLMSDLVGMSDAISRRSAAFRTTIDNLGLTDQVIRQSAAFRVITESLGITDSVTVLLVGAGLRLIRVTELLALTDTVSRQSAAVRTLSDNLGLSDVAGTATAAVRKFQDAIGISDSAFRLLAVRRAVSDLVALADQVSRTSGSFRNVQDQVGESDLVQRTAGALRQATEILGLADQVLERTSFVRRTADSAGVADQAARRVSAQRSIEDLLGLDAEVELSTASAREIAESFGAIDDVLRQVDHFRMLTDSLGGADQSIIDLLLALTLSDNLFKKLFDEIVLTDLFGE